jgi:hypothetical protein
MPNKIGLISIGFTLLLFITSLCLADDFSTDVAALVDELSNKLEWRNYPPVIGLGDFFYADSRMSSEFAYHLASEIEVVITNSPRLRLVERSRLGEILDELGFQLTDIVDPETAKRPGKILGLDALLVGGYSAWEKKVRVTLKLIRVEDAKAFVITKLVDDVPKNVTIRPPGYEMQKRRIAERIQDWLTEGPVDEQREPRSDFRVTIEPELREKPYKEGDELKLYVKSDRDCYIEIYNISEDGSTQLIFPNEFWLEQHSSNDNFIQANVRTAIPYDSSFRIKISPPYGVDTLKIIASNKPFRTRTRSFYQERGPFPRLGNIDQDQTLEALRLRTRSVLSESRSAEGTAQVAQSYCTVLTEP